MDATVGIVGAITDVNRYDYEERRPIHCAAYHGQSRMLKILLYRGAEVNVRDRQRMTALHYAAENGHTSAIATLIEGGAMISARDRRQWTPLHLAAYNGHAEAARMLVDAEERSEGGWQVLALSPDESTQKLLFELAEERGHGEVVAALLDRGKAVGYLRPDAVTYRQFDYENAGLEPLETKAFQYTAQAFYDFLENGVMIGLNIMTPYKLLNIRTGELVKPDAARVQFVIASYMWYPEAITSISDGRIKIPNKAPDKPGEFESRVRQVCEAFPECVTTYDADEGIGDIKMPVNISSKLDASYVREAYLLVAQEAHRRGIDYIWMDCLCIDQSDKWDKARNLNMMDKYYRTAECCVAVSEVLRRKIRADPREMDFDGHWEVGDDVLFWISGFHCSRVWLFQEIYSSSDVVTKGGGLRIDSTKFLAAYHEHFKKPNHVSSKLCSDPNYGHFREFVKKYPSWGLTTLDNSTFSVDDGLECVRYRSCTVPADSVYGALTIFPVNVVESMNIDYRLPISALYPLITYARISNDDLNGLLILRRAGQEKHRIVGAPSWIPTGRGAKFRDGQGEMLKVPGYDESGRSFQDRSCVQYPRVLRLKMRYLPVKKVKMASAAVRSGQLMDHNIVLTFGFRWGCSLRGSYEGAIEPIEYCPDQAGDHEKDAEDYNAGFLKLENGVKCGRVVAVLLDKPACVARNAALPRVWPWLILCAGDGGKTWTRMGVARTGETAVRAAMGAKWFRVI